MLPLNFFLRNIFFFFFNSVTILFSFFFVSLKSSSIAHLLCFIGEGQGDSEGDEEELDDDEDCLSFR